MLVLMSRTAVQLPSGYILSCTLELMLLVLLLLLLILLLLLLLVVGADC